jgi:hypothetical protein
MLTRAAFFEGDILPGLEAEINSQLLDDFTPTQCANFLANAGYDPD